MYMSFQYTWQFHVLVTDLYHKVIIVVLPAPDSQGFIVTADYGHTPLLVLVAAIEKYKQGSSTIIFTQLLIIHKSELG